MYSRRQKVLEAATRLLAASGMRGLTHRSVDREAALPQGSTSNLYRTRTSLVEALAAHIADHRLTHGADTAPDTSAAWFELLLEAQRNTEVAEALRPLRTAMITRLGSARSDSLPLTDGQLAAVLTGLEFAESVTGQHVAEQVVELLRTTCATSSLPTQGD
ncbi:TetR/AcrR family transcriptional regulator [Paramicrobacterium fandaimingii]|uniref:TetR/AcrR family transcriptional regulator n=1 Tax=Paramicrobacterium fandaimingii TaxID=2708079 RepID=UPI00189CFB38|nr:hypothetical protein [Microbacterium fandaimingii]